MDSCCQHCLVAAVQGLQLLALLLLLTFSARTTSKDGACLHCLQDIRLGRMAYLICKQGCLAGL